MMNNFEFFITVTHIIGKLKITYKILNNYDKFPTNINVQKKFKKYKPTLNFNFG